MKGIHHIGLAVSGLTESCSFFCDLFGSNQVQKVNEYSAIFASNGSVIFTLWKTGWRFGGLVDCTQEQ